MKNIIVFAFVGALAVVSVAEEPSVKPVEKTMPVARCQAILKNGSQCPYPAGKDEQFCWRHRGAAKKWNDTMADANKGANDAIKATRTWTTNAWENTKKAVDGARTGLIEMLGGKDAKK